MSRKRKIWVAVSLAAALVLLFPLVLRWQAQWRLSAYRKELIASGEKLTVEEVVPKGDWNAANTPQFLKLASRLPSFGYLYPSAMRPIKPGVARVVWSQTRCIQKIDESKPAVDLWPVLMDAARTNQPTFGQLQALVNTGGIAFTQDYSQPDLVHDSHLQTCKELVRTFAASAMLSLHEGQKEEAIEHLNTCRTVCQLLARDPLMLDQLVLYACQSMMLPDYWEALQAGGWTDDQLARLRRPWDQPSFLLTAEATLAMERAREPMTFRLLRSLPGDNAEIWNDFLVNSRTGAKELLTAFPRYWAWRWIWSYQDERRYLEFMQTMILATRDVQTGRSVLALLRKRNTSGYPLSSSATDVDFIGPEIRATESFVWLALREQTVANMVTAAIALERFRLAHHAYPAALANLAPEYVSAVPVDCMDGHDLRYRLNPDGSYLLYSVGADGVDDGGDPTPEKDKNMYFLNGRDWVWPRPATDEEVQAYDAEQTKPKAGTKRP